MSYSRELFEYGWQVLNRRRQIAAHTLQQRKQDLYEVVPRLREIENELSETGYAAIRCAMSGAQGLSALEQIKKRNLALQNERGQILADCGFPEDYLTEPHICPICHDEGFVDGKRCQCFEKIMREEAFRRLNSQSPLSLCDFENFDLTYYSSVPDASGGSAREQMSKIFRYCKNYAASFSVRSGNILMQGPTGLGKTHLSLAIAKAAIQKGFGVIYGSAPDLMAQVEKERFSRIDNGMQTLEWLLDCNLLVLDDLGAEFSTSFSAATIYNLVNTRINRHLPTIVSTNLTHQGLLQAYDERVVSRLIGTYDTLFFAGQDIRQKKEQEKLK